MYTRHFVTRMRGRGIQECLVECLRAHSDRTVHVGDGCTAELVSKPRLVELEADGTVPAPLAERLDGLVLVRAADGSLVTVLRLHGHKARYYTRDHRKRRRAHRRSGANALASFRARTPLKLRSICTQAEGSFEL